MLIRTFVVIGALSLSAAWRPLESRHPHRTPRDLDKYTDARLDRDLQAELSEIFDGHDRNEPVDIQELNTELMEALSDEHDDGDPSRLDISFEDIEAEMEEDGTTVADVVMKGLRQVDRASAGTGMLVLASYTGSADLRVTRELAVRQTKKEIIREIRAR